MSQLRLSPSTNHSSSNSKATGTLQPSLRTATICILPLLSIAGAIFTWGLAFKNGQLFQLFSLLEQKPYATFPGTIEPLIVNYTGFEPADRYLAILVAFFGPIVGGQYPDMSAFAKPGISEFAVAWTFMVMEGLRVGNRGKVLS